MSLSWQRFIQLLFLIAYLCELAFFGWDIGEPQVLIDGVDIQDVRLTIIMCSLIGFIFMEWMDNGR